MREPRLQSVIIEKSQVRLQHMQLRILLVRIILVSMVVSAVVVVVQVGSARLMEIFLHSRLLPPFPVSRSPRFLFLGFQVAFLDPILTVSFPVFHWDGGSVDEEAEEGGEDDGKLYQSHIVVFLQL